ncbi:hypothetical protein [Williamsia sp.]|uniref:hypothetical protein n=1 Tax=Williamsia sp. TaxID=1872085 RepID=UPI002F942F87
MDLLTTVKGWQRSGNALGIFACAAWLYRCADQPARQGMIELLEQSSSDVQPFELALHRTAERRFAELAHWCILTITRMPGAELPDVGTWLPELTRALTNSGIDLTGALLRIAVTDMSLLTCSQDTLSRNGAHVREYQRIRATLLTRAAERN